MGQLTTTQLSTYTWDDILGMSLQEFCGRGMSLYDQTGNSAYLRGDSAIIEQLLHQGKISAAVVSELQSLKTEKALGTFLSHVWTYAQVSADADFLPWSVVSGSRPASDSQLILFVNGQLSMSWKISQTGIQISEALTAGQIAEAIILSESLKASHTEFSYDGSNGTGAGNLTWAVQNLGEDLFGNTPAVPGATTKIWVYLNGVKQAQGVGVNIVVGSGTCTVTFLNDSDPDFEVGDSDNVAFVIWRS